MWDYTFLFAIIDESTYIHILILLQRGKNCYYHNIYISKIQFDFKIYFIPPPHTHTFS